MEKVRNDALVHYYLLSQEKKDAVVQFFKALDRDNSGTVSINELADFFTDGGVDLGTAVNMFKLLDQNGNGTLDFTEMIIFVYFIAIGPGAESTTITRGNSKNLEKWKTAMEIVTASFDILDDLSACSIM